MAADSSMIPVVRAGGHPSVPLGVLDTVRVAWGGLDLILPDAGAAVSRGGWYRRASRRNGDFDSGVCATARSRVVAHRSSVYGRACRAPPHVRCESAEHNIILFTRLSRAICGRWRLNSLGRTIRPSWRFIELFGLSFLFSRVTRRFGTPRIPSEPLPMHPLHTCAQLLN